MDASPHNPVLRLHYLNLSREFRSLARGGGDLRNRFTLSMVSSLVSEVRNGFGFAVSVRVTVASSHSNNNVRLVVVVESLLQLTSFATYDAVGSLETIIKKNVLK